MLWWDALVAVHVLAAVVGIGPTFAYHLLLHKGQEGRQLLDSLELMKTLDAFPKVAGPAAVLSGIALAAFYDYGGFRQLWLTGSLALFAAIQIIVIGAARAPSKVLYDWREEALSQLEPAVPAGVEAAVGKLRYLFWLVHALTVALLLLMIWKPAVPLW
ncbi:DUF2269 family protein [Paenibacillus sp.]|uniref:DUF2269 family protein n=1 Tax=Paenibacillus sp. TaxID=58172 RepID=UPI002D2C9983|nr:DUF2269 family protein [Paenibacillus sp.]HZG86398.1 DUF2269 family protein [Paenibacillus sp.]